MIKIRFNLIMAQQKNYSKNYKEIRLFKSDILESFSHVNPIIPALIWVPTAIVFFVRSFTVHHMHFAEVALLMGLGTLTWTFSEYILHRYVFHWGSQHPLAKQFVYTMHGIHHDAANDPTRLVMPPVPSLVFGWGFYFLFLWAFGPLWVSPYFVGFILGYLAYDYTHFAIHHFTPRTRFGRFLKQHHMVHHYADHDAKWGVSSPLWDYIFGTTEPRQSHTTTPTAH